jgi:hypothetical protein
LADCEDADYLPSDQDSAPKVRGPTDIPTGVYYPPQHTVT